MTTEQFTFDHGLGDVSNLARLASLYRRRGIELQVVATPDKHFALEVGGIELVKRAAKHHGWWIQSNPMSAEPSWRGNKPGENMRHFGLGELDSMEALWEEYKASTPQAHDRIPESELNEVAVKMRDWPRPIILWHPIGNTSQGQKSFTPDRQRAFARALLDQSDGTVLILDWDRRVTWTAHNRLRHLDCEFGGVSLCRLAAIMELSDLFIGVDSGPFHFAAMTNIPAVSVWPEGWHPGTYMVPWERSMAITLGNHPADAMRRFEWRIVNVPDGSMESVARTCLRTLEHGVDKTHFDYVVSLTQGRGGAGCLSEIYDRHRSFGAALARVPRPTNIVETGCVRQAEDWGGAGMSTVLFAYHAKLYGGHVTSFDTDDRNCEFARQQTKQFGCAEVRHCTGEQGILELTEPIDLLYLDSLDTVCIGYAETNLKEFMAAEPLLHAGSVVVVDDTPSMKTGKGSLTVPYAINRGWRVLSAGYQVVLVK